MGFDVARARAETPGCETVIHLANGGAGLMPAPVLNAVKDHLDLEARIGGYEARRAREDQVEGLYDSAARYFNCSADEIASVENATVAWDMAFYSLSFKPGDRILTAAAEYASNYIAYLQVARRTGAVVEVVPNDNSGQLDVKALENMIDDDNAGSIKAKLVLELANGPVTPAGDRVLAEKGVVVLPDILANAGGVTVSYFEWVQNRQGFYWTEKEIHERLQSIMEREGRAIWNIAREKEVSVRTAAYVHALGRLAEAIEAHGTQSFFTS